MNRTARSDRPSRSDHLVIALVSCAVLLYEIAVTRLLSVVLWYHFAFLAVSLAMVGLGAPGVWFSVRPPRRAALRGALVASGLAIPASIALIVHLPRWLPGDGVVFAALGVAATAGDLRVGATVVGLLLPLLLMGSVVCFLLIEARGARIGGMYASDLIGATLGACAVVPLMWVIPTPNLLAGLGLLPLIAALVATRRRPWIPITCMVAVGLLSVWGVPFQVRHNKIYAESDMELLYEKWTPTARLTVFPGVFWRDIPERAFGWGMGSRFPDERIDQLWIEQDGSAGTPITRYTGAPGDTDHLFYDVTSVGYQLRSPKSVCIIGSGGGRDILTALEAGAEHIDAVELNPEMIEVVTGVFADFSGDVYHLPGVEAHASEGRSFLTRTPRRYDLIQVSLIDSWAATAAGAYALSENYLYTVEALRLYWSRLTDSGVLSVSRWMGGWSVLESPRLALLIVEALAREGITEPRRHMIVMRRGRVGTMLVSRTPFSSAQVAQIDAIAAERGFSRHWPPPVDPGKKSLVQHVLTSGSESLEAQGLTLTPPTDDRPFFFQNVRAFTPLDPEILERMTINDMAARLPRTLIAFLLTLTVALFFAPFALLSRFERHPLFWRGSAYFVAVGLAFMLVEIPFIQRFILYLGHPSYATTVLLSTILLGAGVGSLAAGRIELGSAWRYRPLLPLAVAAVNLVLEPLFGATLGWPLAARVAVSAAAVGPLAVCLGFAFPIGMIRFGDGNRAWFWAMNGAASVLAGAATVALASYIGLTGVVWLSVAGYAAACLLLPAPEPAPRDRSD